MYSITFFYCTEYTLFISLNHLLLPDVTTCELTKMQCINCDLVTSDAPCDPHTFYAYTKEQCYDGVDGINFVMAEYRVETSVCQLSPCVYDVLSYRALRITTMMTCSYGILFKIFIWSKFRRNIFLHVIIDCKIHFPAYNYSW